MHLSDVLGAVPLLTDYGLSTLLVRSIKGLIDSIKLDTHVH